MASRVAASGSGTLAGAAGATGATGAAGAAGAAGRAEWRGRPPWRAGRPSAVWGSWPRAYPHPAGAGMSRKLQRSQGDGWWQPHPLPKAFWSNLGVRARADHTPPPLQPADSTSGCSCSPHRLERPWQGQVEAGGRETRLAYDPALLPVPRQPARERRAQPGLHRRPSPSTTTSPRSCPERGRRRPIARERPARRPSRPPGAAACSASRPATT